MRIRFVLFTVFTLVLLSANTSAQVVTDGLIIQPEVYSITAADIATAKAIVDLRIVINPPASVELSASPDTLPGDGVSQSTITATLKDAQGKTLSNQNVTFKIITGEGRSPQPLPIMETAHTRQSTRLLNFKVR